MISSKVPFELCFDRETQQLTLSFEETEKPFQLSYEFLRVHSPSAEVQGHRPSEAILQWGKKSVSVERVEAVGNYAIKPFFSDGHATGIFTWDYLYYLCIHHDTLWTDYLENLRQAHLSREPSHAITPLFSC
jgi:DUF971 family protein